MTTSELLGFYRGQSPVTDPRDWSFMLDHLPDDPLEIARLLPNVLLHNWKTYAEGMVLTPERRAEIEIRPIARLLERLHQVDAASWDRERPNERKVVVDCRHFATLMCAVFRHRGVPARIRFGFAKYLMPSHRQSHVVCEFWDEFRKGWVRIDADTLQLDMAADQFLSAGEAWKQCRSGVLDPHQLGYAVDARGLWCARWELIRDLAALNKQEMLTFDVWGLNESLEYNAEVGEDDQRVLDEIAARHDADAAQFDLLGAVFTKDARFAVPRIVKCQPYTTGKTHFVDLTEEGSLLEKTSRTHSPS